VSAESSLCQFFIRTRPTYRVLQARNLHPTMEWSPDFCLVCDRQTDGAIYCGEACRLAEYEKANSASGASSPVSPGGFPTSWPSISTTNNSYFVSTYDSVARRFDSSARISSPPLSRPHSSPIVTSSRHILTPSSSQSSIASMQSSSSMVSASAESSHLSDEACRELRAYAGSFDRSRYERRQSA